MIGFGLKKQTNREAVDRISGWLTNLVTIKYPFIRKDEIQYAIQEVLCNEPNCAPIETLVVIFLESKLLSNFIQPSRFATKILKPINDVVKSDVDELELPFRFQNHSLQEFIESLEMSVSNTLAIYPDKTLVVPLLTRVLEGTIETIKNGQAQKHDDNNSNKKICSRQITRVEMISSDSNSVNAKEEHSSTMSPITIVSGVSPQSNTSIPLIRPDQLIQTQSAYDQLLKPRHDKEMKRRGCPCCDPDNLDNLVDKMIFMQQPPT